MKYARDRKITSSHTAEVLIEAFPWIKNATGKTILIKYGGAAMVDPELRNAVMSDIVMLKIMGVNPVIVHGGGAAINKNMDKFGIDVEFKDGQRVTSDEAMDVVKMTLVGKVNEELVLAMNEHGNLAVGVNGTDAGTIIAKQRSPELGRVGTVTEVNPAYINALIASDYVPIIASVGKGDDGGSYNINADAAACAIASAIGAHKIIFLTDVDGFYEDFSDKSSLISQMTVNETREMLESGSVSSGMTSQAAVVRGSHRRRRAACSHRQRHQASFDFSGAAYFKRCRHPDLRRHGGILQGRDAPAGHLGISSE